ncbi:efflux RND transporter periplasmic adaptor subunit [uncultured Amphritea sp.]|uniref:efflux RND transporter periplasmic adaptor subunit n=1 Tax=uncultured Amphritea sp. TaxID=981605 RepID=UPI00260FE449|nr:efflux RND transporter periplasmic adaptor subunit [uncultured Amphritea sp.]
MPVFPRLFPLVCLAVLLGLAGCSDNNEAAVVPDVVRPAKIFQVTDNALATMRNFPAEVEANADSKLAFRVGGQVTEFPIRPGNEVEKGQLLARLDPTDFKLTLDDRQARYELAKSQFERSQTMLERKLISESSFDQAKSELQIALASLNVAKAELEYTYLRAPFSGSVAKVMVEKHENIQAKQTILVLQTRDQVDVSIQMPENIISRIKKDTGYQPTVTFDSHPDKAFPVTVKEWDTQPDSSTLTYKVVFSLSTPGSFNVLPGMGANIRIDLSKVTEMNDATLMLPLGAVFAAEDAPLSAAISYVWKVDPQSMKVHRAEVKVGEIKEQGIEILSGIQPGDQVVSVGVHALIEGQKIRPWTREGGL